MQKSSAVKKQGNRVVALPLSKRPPKKPKTQKEKKTRWNAFNIYVAPFPRVPYLSTVLLEAFRRARSQPALVRSRGLRLLRWDRAQAGKLHA